MKKLLHIAVLGLLLTAVQAQAENDKMMQPNKMTADEKKPKGMKGDERKTKMSACLKG